jgi:hypothetical protein
MVEVFSHASKSLSCVSKSKANGEHDAILSLVDKTMDNM